MECKYNVINVQINILYNSVIFQARFSLKPTSAVSFSFLVDRGYQCVWSGQHYKSFFFNCLHTKSLFFKQFLKPDTQTPEPHTKSAKPYTNFHADVSRTDTKQDVVAQQNL